MQLEPQYYNNSMNYSNYINNPINNSNTNTNNPNYNNTLNNKSKEFKEINEMKKDDDMSVDENFNFNEIKMMMRSVLNY